MVLTSEFEKWLKYNNLYMENRRNVILGRLFQRKSLAIVIARSSSSLSSSCKNFNVDNNSKIIKGISTKLGMLAHFNKMHDYESYSFGVFYFLTF